MPSDLDRLNLLLTLGRYAEGEKAAREAIGENPEWGTAYGFLALFLSNQGHHLPAIRAAKDCVGKDPHDPWGHAVRACVLNRLDRTRQALAAADEAIRLDPTYAYARCVRCEILCTEERYRDARITAIDGLRHHPTDEMLLHWKGWVEYRTGRLDAAVKTAEEGLRHHPDSAALRNVLGCALMERAEGRTPIGRVRDHKRAEEAFREAIRLRPSETAYQENRRNNAVRGRRYVLWVLLIPLTILSFAAAVTGSVVAMGGGLPKPGAGVIGFAAAAYAIGLVFLQTEAEWVILSAPVGRLDMPTVPLTRNERKKGFWLWLLVAGALVGAPAAAWVLALSARP
jgi:tetratricopeptide (TPR) repeat protein